MQAVTHHQGAPTSVLPNAPRGARKDLADISATPSRSAAPPPGSRPGVR